MRQAAASFFVSFLLCVFPVLGFCQDVSKLGSVKRIYIGDLGREEGSDLVREKIRLALMRSDRFRVVEKPESADAILTGVAGVQRRHHSTITTDPTTGNVSGGGGTSFSGIGVLRLVDVKSDETIWVFEYKRGFSLGSASSRVANKAVEKLIKDAKTADRKSTDVRK
jgi:hypothetical protein